MADPAVKGLKKIEKQNEALEQLRVEYVAIDGVKPNDYNPNRQSEDEHELLMRSIREDGFTQPIVVANDYTIVDGEHRWRAAATLGMTTIPVVVVPMGPEQARIATLRHNRARGSEDLTLTAQVLRDLEKLGALDWAQDSLMLDDVELQRLLEDIPAPDALAAEEFGEAWQPTRTIGDSENDSGTGDGSTVASSTTAAIEAQRNTERRIAEARTEEEKQAIRRDSDTYRVIATFTGEEGKIVAAQLGKAPAINLLRLCTVAGQHPELFDAADPLDG